jgi:peptide deformylase
MSIVKIISDTDPFLRKTSRRIRHVDSKLRELVADMYEIMAKNWGIGLAAIQVGVPKRLFIYEIPHRPLKGYEACPPKDQAEESDDDGVSEDAGYSGDYTVCINPRITAREGSYIDDEGCLSRTGWVAKVERAIKVTFEAWDINMKKFERTVEGMEARCVQHEIDHLDGILFTDRAVPGTLREFTEEELAEDEGGPDDRAVPEQDSADGKEEVEKAVG